MPAYFDDTSSGAMGGAATGALIGSAVPGVGTAIGAGAGALIGGVGGWFKGRANSKQKDSQKKAREKLEELKRRAYAQRMADLNKTMSFFGPAQQAAQSLYGGTGQTMDGSNPGGYFG